MLVFVLNFPVTNCWDTMPRTCRMFILAIFFAMVAIRPALAQTGLKPIIKTPQAGDVLQGTIPITGSDVVTGFLLSEVAFAYAGDTTGTWFLIAANSQPVEDGMLATWDTTTITDGNYVLRLRVALNDGTFLDVAVPDVRVRNYTPIETPTPAPTAMQPTRIPTVTLTPTLFPTPTTMPGNPAVLTPVDVSISVAYGGVVAVILLFVIGIYLWLRRK
jgi:hypothetical protein